MYPKLIIIKFDRYRIDDHGHLLAIFKEPKLNFVKYVPNFADLFGEHLALKILRLFL